MATLSAVWVRVAGMGRDAAGARGEGGEGDGVSTTESRVKEIMEPENLSLVALTPAELPAAQSAIIEWCDRKIESLTAAVNDLDKNIEIAKRNLWRCQGLQNAVNRDRRRIQFYEKIGAALQAGYLIIPNFPIDAFAVRVQRQKPPAIEHGYLNDRLRNAAPELLPIGEGRYVDDLQAYRDKPTQEPDHQGKPETRHHFTPTDYYEEWDFPFALVKPTVLTAVERAMALKIFDQVGVVRERKSDPIIVGQLIDPRSTRYNQRRVTFFVAWWLNTSDL